MALTVSVAPVVQAPAARPARAAAPAASERAGQFDAVLARTAGRRAVVDGRPGRAAERGDEVPETSERDQTDDTQNAAVGFEPCVRFLPTLADPQQPEGHEPATPLAIAAGVEDKLSGSPEPSARVLSRTGDLDPSPGLGLPEPISTGPTPSMPSMVPTVIEPVQLAQSTVAVAAATAKTVARAERSDAPLDTRVEPSQQFESAEAPEGPGEGPAEAARKQAGRPTTATPGAAPRAEARAIGQAIMADALGVTQAPSRVSATATPDRVATTPLPVPQAQPTGTADATSAASKNRTFSAPVDVSGEPATIAAQTSGQTQAGDHEGGQPHGQDRGASTARTMGSAAAAALPESMVFLGQATFAAALDRTVPLAKAAPPAFGGQALDTVVPQIVRSLHMQVTSGGGDMTLTLTPEHLGTVTIELRVDQQRVSASLGADTAAVRGWIAAHEQDLKAGLADLGLQLDEFVVRDEDPRQREPRERQPAPQRRKRMKSDETAFEVQA